MATDALNNAPSIAVSRRVRAFSIAARPTVLFLAAFAFNVSPHEAVHAIVAYLLGFNSTVFQMWVNPDAATASSSQVAAIAASGPLFSLIVGTIGLLIYLRLKRRPAGLFFLMFGLIGIYSFLGPIGVSAFGGDFHTALQALGIPKGYQYATSALGIVLLAIFTFFMGRELSGWAPLEFGRLQTVISTTVSPWLVGTLLVLLIYWPLPGFLVSSSINGSVFWAFSVLGAALCTRRTSANGYPITPLLRSDLIITSLAVLMVRVLAHGIRLAH